MPEITAFIHEHPELAIANDGLTRAYHAVRSSKYKPESELLKDADGYYFTITNIYIDDDDDPEDPEEEKDVKVRKVWSGGDGKNRPEIRVRLYKDGKAYRTVTLSDGNWRHVWEGISDDDDIEWSVEELDVPKGYTAKVRQVSDRSFIITNTWDEEENRYTGA